MSSTYEWSQPNHLPDLGPEPRMRRWRLIRIKHPWDAVWLPRAALASHDLRMGSGQIEVAQSLALATLTHPSNCGVLTLTCTPEAALAEVERRPHGPGRIILVEHEGSQYAVVNRVAWEFRKGGSCAAYPSSTAFIVIRAAYATSGCVPAVWPKGSGLCLVALSDLPAGFEIPFCSHRRSQLKTDLGAANTRYAVKFPGDLYLDGKPHHLSQTVMDPWLFPAGVGLLANEPTEGCTHNAALEHHYYEGSGKLSGKLHIKTIKDVPKGSEITIHYNADASGEQAAGYEPDYAGQSSSKRTKGASTHWPDSARKRLRVDEDGRIEALVARGGGCAVSQREAVLHGGISSQFMDAALTNAGQSVSTTDGLVFAAGANFPRMVARHEFGLAVSSALGGDLPEHQVIQADSAFSTGRGSLKKRMIQACIKVYVKASPVSSPFDPKIVTGKYVVRISSIAKAQMGSLVDGSIQAIDPGASFRKNRRSGPLLKVEPSLPEAVPYWDAPEKLGVTGLLFAVELK